MRLISQLERADCRAIVAAAHAEAAQRQAVVSVAVVDGGGHPLLRHGTGTPRTSKLKTETKKVV